LEKLGEFMMMKKMLLIIALACFYQSIETTFADQKGDEQRAQVAKEEALAAAQARVANASVPLANCTGNNSQECNSARTDLAQATADLKVLSGQQASEAKRSALKGIGDEESKRVAAAACKKNRDEKKAAAKKYTSNGNNEAKDGDMGTPTMKKCVELSGNNMRYLYGQHRKTVDWNVMIEGSEECINAFPACSEGEVAEQATRECADLKALAARCDGAAFLINEFGRDWKSAEHVKPPDVKGLTPEIKCTAQGIATVDYEGCAKFVQDGAIMDAAQGAIQTGQELYYKDKAMTAQMEASSSTESASAGLKALKTGVKGQEDIMTQRAALDAGKLAALASYYAEIPSYADLTDKCAKYTTVVIAGQSADGCRTAATQQQDFGFLMNQQAREKMKAKLAAVGINVATDAMMAGLMAKQAGNIDNAIAKVDAPAADNLQTTYCQQNPGDAKCLTGGLERTFDPMGDNVITFGEGGTGTVYANNIPTLPGTTGTSNTATPTTKNSITGAGSVISAAQQKGGLADTAAKATVTKGTAPAGGGGGGGSGGGGSGGGGGGAPAGQQAGGITSAVPGRAPSYGGGSGTLSMMGGYGINKGKSTAKDDSNPFGKLFNKDGNKSGAIDFSGRSPASKVGNKTDNLFEMISKRYTNVNNDKRLIEYEMTK
jgi:hypothetical protein